MAQWAKGHCPDVVVMESTGIYWKSPYAALESVGIAAWVVNARHVKTVPGRKTDVADAQWLATLARAGLLRPSFIPPADLRHLRLIARQRQKLGGMLASEKNRLHKLLADAGIRLNVVVSDIHGQAGRAMVKALIAGKSVHRRTEPRQGVCAPVARQLFEALQAEEISDPHVFVLTESWPTSRSSRPASFALMSYAFIPGLDAGRSQLILLQTFPGIDLMGAAMLLVEIGTDMSVLRQCGTSGVVGRHVSGQQRVRRQAQERDASEKATPGCVGCCASSRKLLGAVAARSRTSLQALSVRKGHKRSIVALGHKMLRTIYAMLSKKTHYVDKTVDYEALMVARNAPRWLQMLVKHGLMPATATA